MTTSAGYKPDGSICRCACHSPEASVMHMMPCCSSQPPWLDLPLHRGCVFDALKPAMAACHDGYAESEMHLNRQGARAMVTFVDPDRYRFEEGKDYADAIFAMGTILGFPVKEVVEDPNPKEPLMLIVKTTNVGGAAIEEVEHFFRFVEADPRYDIKAFYERLARYQSNHIIRKEARS